MSDQELDDLFKEAAGKLNTPFDSADWKKMEGLLDEGTVRPAFWNWKKYVLGIIIFLSAVVSMETWLSMKNAKREVSSTKNGSVKSEAKTLSKIEEKISEKDQFLMEENVLMKENVVREVNANDQKKSSVNRTRPEESVPIRHVSNEQHINTKRQSDESVSLINENVEAQLSQGNNSGMNSRDQPIETRSEVEKNSITDSLLNSTLVKNDSLAVMDEELAKEKEEEKLSKTLSVKLVLSPDYSSVGYFTPGKTGLNYGLLAEYALGRHVSISTGAIWSIKLYSNKSSEGSVYGQVMNSKKIDGDCRILDIPVNVNYYFNPGQRFTVYGSLGLSSYIMFKENYNYSIVNSGKSYDYSTQVERKNNEWFKMSNLSIGLQYQLRKHWSIQAEPFVKAPLSGIGEGNYKLVSSGVFVNVKYTFN